MSAAAAMPPGPARGPGPLLVFQVGPRLYAADAAEVERIAPAAPSPELVEGTCLGPPLGAQRGLWVRGVGAALAVDLVVGVRQPAAAELVPLPELAARCLASRAVRSLVLLDGIPTPVLDLPTLIGEARAAAPAAGEPRHA